MRRSMGSGLRRARVLLVFILFVGVLVPPAIGFAQIVNTESLFRHEHDKPASLVLMGNLSKDQGNTELFVLGGQVAARARKGDHEGLFNASHERASAQDALVGNRSFSHLRYRYYLAELVQGEVYGQVAQDRFRLMTSRFVVGAGPRFVPVLIGPFVWVVAASHLYEVERLDDSADFDSLVRKRHRLSVMSSAGVQFEKVTIQQTFYLQPAWADPTNIRVFHLFNAQVSLGKYVSVTWALEQSLDTIAPSDVRPLDVHFRSGLKFEL